MQPLRFSWTSGSTLGFSIERLSDSTYYNFTTRQFQISIPSVGDLIAALTEQPAPFAGRYKGSFDDSDISQFTAGAYAINVHDLQDNNTVIDELGDTITINGGTVSTGTTGLIVSIADAQANTPGFSSLASARQASLVAAATAAINGHCRRCIPLTLHDELYDPENTRQVRLRNWPVTKILRLAVRPFSVLTVTGPATAQRATAELVTTGTLEAPAMDSLSLWSITAGVESTIPLSFTTYKTLSALATAVAGQSGWTAAVSPGFESYATADLNIDLGQKSATSPSSPAAFWAFTRDLALYDLDRRSGIITLHEDLYQGHRFPDRVWAAAGQWGSARIRYWAGFNADPNAGTVTMPEEIKAAAYILIQQLVQYQADGDQQGNSSAGGGYTYVPAAQALLPRIKHLLKNHVNRRSA